MLLYVDDVHLATKEMAKINELNKVLSSEFEMEDIGAARESWELILR